MPLQSHLRRSLRRSLNQDLQEMRLKLLKFRKRYTPFSLRFQLITGLLIGIMFLGCNENELVNERHSMGEMGWLQKNQLEIPFEITDTTTIYDLQVAIRQTNTYSFYNLYFISEILSEAGTSLKKAEAEAIFYDAKSGKPKGSGIGDMYSHSYTIFKNVKFPKSGAYRIRLQQNMRVDTLEGILSVGASLVKKK
jgi:gliding motility-associated lipoprotein GldH